MTLRLNVEALGVVQYDVAGGRARARPSCRRLAGLKTPHETPAAPLAAALLTRGHGSAGRGLVPASHPTVYTYEASMHASGHNGADDGLPSVLTLSALRESYAAGHLAPVDVAAIGRASCRERVSIAV